jgi:hypothetical protein
MRRELWWGAITIAALTVASVGAREYARLAAPYYAAVAHLFALGHPWQIVSVEVRNSAVGLGSELVLIGDVRRQSSDVRPAARVVARVQVGEAVETPAVFWTMLLLWPAGYARQTPTRVAVGVPMFLALEAITTTMQLVHSLPTASALLAGATDPITLAEQWSRFLEAGGRYVVEVCGVMLTIVIAQRLSPKAIVRALEIPVDAHPRPIG